MRLVIEQLTIVFVLHSLDFTSKLIWNHFHFFQSKARNEALSKSEKMFRVSKDLTLVFVYTRVFAGLVEGFVTHSLILYKYSLVLHQVVVLICSFSKLCETSGVYKKKKLRNPRFAGKNVTLHLLFTRAPIRTHFTWSVQFARKFELRNANDMRPSVTKRVTLVTPQRASIRITLRFLVTLNMFLLQILRKTISREQVKFKLYSEVLRSHITLRISLPCGH